MNLQLQQTKLLRLWQIIFAEGQPYQLKGLRHYVVGYYARDPKPLALIDYLAPFAPTFQSAKLNPVQAYLATFNAKRIAPKEMEGAEIKFRLVLTDVFQRTEEYIIQTAALIDFKNYPHSGLLDLYTHQSLRDCFEDYWRSKGKALSDNFPVVDIEEKRPLGFRYLHERFWAKQAYMDYQLMVGEYSENNLIDVANALHDCTEAYQLRLEVEQLVFGADYRYDLNSEVAKTNISPLLSLYKTIKIGLNSSDNREKETCANQVFILFEQQSSVLSYQEANEIFTNISNLISNMLRIDRMNDTHFARLHRLYTLAENIGVLWHKDGTLDWLAYKNVVTVSLIVNDLERAKTFTESQKKRLLQNTKTHRSNTEDAYQYNLAQIAFAEKRYFEVENLLRFRNDEYSLLSVNAEVLLLKTYYEQEIKELRGKYLQTDSRKSSFLLRLNQFKKRIKKEKALQITMYNNFLYYLDFLANLHCTYRIGTKIPEDALDTKTLFEEHTPTLEERWLRKKVAQCQATL
ncbi:MAG: hypothetical protein RI894_2274 [Bacteroidota bacterium]|jgi:hypothetical protein